MDRLRVRVLGPVDVVADDGSVQNSGSALRRALLALLALHNGEVLSPAWLMENLWVETQPESGVRALRFHVSQLRKECGHVALIETRPGGYCLDLPVGSVDAGLFEQLLKQARLEPDDVQSTELCNRALALWRGDPFVDAAPCSALDHEAGRLDELRIGGIEHSSVRRLGAGAAAELISDLSQLVNEHPLREGLWSSLMTAQYRAGRQADALATYERLRSNLVESLGLDPSPELQDLQMRVLRQDPDLAVPITAAAVSSGRSRRHNLPAPATSFLEPVGGFDELVTMMDACRLMTLTGSGGVGKTRLGIELGSRRLDDFADGVFLVELAPVVAPEGVVAAVGTALSVQPQPGLTELESIVHWCRGRELLLIVDNCEHVIDAVSAAIAELVAQCPSISIIATSREALRLDGEYVHRVASLGLATGIELFNQRATAADSGFVVDETEVVGSLCEQLDGIPLAIELAAGRVRSMSPAELVERLDDRFRLLRGAARGRPDRHQTLRATIEWSYQLLSDGERVVFERLSVFAGDFDVAAAEAVCSCDTVDPADVIDLLGGLVDKSMVVASRTATSTRYHLLETLRQFGGDQLVAHRDGDEPHDRHLTYFVEIAERTDQTLRGPREREALQFFEREWHNLRTAHQRATTTGDLGNAERLLNVLFRWARSMTLYETASWIDRTLEVGTDGRQSSPHTYGQAGFWAAFGGRYGLALDRAKQGIEAAPSPDSPSTALCWALYADLTRIPGLENRRNECGEFDPTRQLERTAEALDLERESWALISLVDVTTPLVAGHEHAGEVAARRHRRHVDRLAKTADQTGSPSLHAYASICQGHQMLIATPSRPDDALRCYQRALAIAQEINDKSAERDSLRAIALAATERAADEHAADACRIALTLLHEVRNWDRIRQTLESSALVLAELGQVEHAAMTLGYLQEHHPAFGLEIVLGFRGRALALVQRDDRADQWIAVGATTNHEEVVLQTIEHLAAAADASGN